MKMFQRFGGTVPEMKCDAEQDLCKDTICISPSVPLFHMFLLVKVIEYGIIGYRL